MTVWRGQRPSLAVVAVALLTTTSAFAQSDISGSSDPVGMTRYPGAWIIEYAPETNVRSYEFVTGEVARIRREVRIDRSIRTAAKLVRVTYRTPNGTRLDDVIEHYEEVISDLGGRVEFTCRGQDCGHSTIWANQVFAVKELAAPDASQFYLASTLSGSAVGLADSGSDALVSVYVVQRPNRRVNAQVDFAIASSSSSGSSAEDVVNALNSVGFAVVATALPNRSGELDEASLEALDGLAPALAAFDGRLVVVCHLGSLDDPEQSRRRTEACAERGSERLRAAGVEAGAFGAGAFLPREGESPDRLELVIPGAKPTP
ncbi:MAG: DUF4892 domain-containing protein [Gammaproteobacteria bacterium]|nr:DUF4892 domain-containing protein [Gammaproteobacteria bacterium]MYF31593.1 DUF4892 domain-containing protein [Gammaproteobacteria bacterium]MYK47112.1 DUF4892 domain-containing protein [Gammaproteobacteria bacterium]